jgi:hypothetical protein
MFGMPLTSSEIAAARALQAELRRPATRSIVDAYVADGERIAKMLKTFEPPRAMTALEQAVKMLDIKPAIDPVKIAPLLANVDLGSSAALRHAVAGLDVSGSTALRQAVAGLNLGGSAALRHAVAGLDVSGSTALRHAIAGFDVGGSTALRQAIAGLDLGSASAASQALATLAGREFKSPAIDALLGKDVLAGIISGAAFAALEHARAALASFDMASNALASRAALSQNLTSIATASRSGLMDSSFLSAQIEASVVRLARIALPEWSRLPDRAMTRFGALSFDWPLTGDANDLMAAARGVYGLASFSARAASLAIAVEPLETELDETIEAWLEGEEAFDLPTALAALHPALRDKLIGAREVYRRGGPDSLSQTANSLIELIDRAMGLLAPREDVLTWATEENLTGRLYVTMDGNPSTALKVRYVLRASPLAAVAIEAQVRALNRARRTLQQAKHELGFNDDPLIGGLLLTVENTFTVLLR